MPDSAPSQRRHISNENSGNRTESSTSQASFSSSLNQKTPARSYFQRTYHGSLAPGDIAYSAANDVREDTAELASWALSDVASIRSGTPPHRHSSSGVNPGASTIESILDESSDNTQIPDQRDPGYPEAIEEVSEPTSPESHPSSRKSNSPSLLTEMIRNLPPAAQEAEQDDDFIGKPSAGPRPVSVHEGYIFQQPHEGTALLQKIASGKPYPHTSFRDVESLENRYRVRFHQAREAIIRWKDRGLRGGKVLVNPKSWDKRTVFKNVVVKPASYVPAIMLGLLLNILDALSYGMILFPLGQPIFASLGPDGISMFYVSCIVSQLVYSCGGSIFKGGIGSEMIEVVPFFHKMAFTILAQVGEDNPKSVLATTILSYSLSSILTGAVFYLMGRCHLGSLIGFFPRHILIGCIGGVGWFLVATGLEVSARLNGNLEYNLVTLQKLFEADTVALWMVPLALAITLTIAKRWVKYALTDAAYFLSIIAIFYFFVAAIPDLNLEDLRSKGWVFEAPEAGVPFYHFYTLYDFGAVDWKALASTVPAMFALTFFGVLHVPINIPALGLSTGEDNVDVDRELRAHGWSNALSGCCGSIQNYLVYVNTILFMRSGGDSRVAGVLLAFATFGVLVMGPAMIGFIPIMVVGALIFFLGFDLIREALVDTWGRVNRIEYLTILVIVITMGAYDFVVGILVGIVLACVSFVLQSSQISAIRGILPTDTEPRGVASSTVRRHPIQHRFLEEVGSQIYVMKLAGYLFFGTIVGVENRVRAILKDEAFHSSPIQFLVLDLSKVDGVDFSAAEAFTRINRILGVRKVQMIMCGIATNSIVQKSLFNVGLLSDNDDVEFFDDLNSALEYCENSLLKAFYQRRDDMINTSNTQKYLDVPPPTKPLHSTETMFSSPRRHHLHSVATTTLQEHQDTTAHRDWQRHSQPLQLILLTFASVSSRDEAFWTRAVPYFHRLEYPAGATLYKRDDPPNGFYLLESGMLKAEYRMPQGTFSELIVAGTTCGELPFFGGTKRTSTTVAERDCVVWMMGEADWEKLQREEGELARELLKCGLGFTSERMEAVTKYMLTSG